MENVPPLKIGIRAGIEELIQCRDLERPGQLGEQR